MTGCGSSGPRPLPQPYVIGAGEHASSIKALRTAFTTQTTEEAFWTAMNAAGALTEAGYAYEVLPVLRLRLQTEPAARRRGGLARELARAGEASAVTVLQDLLLQDQQEPHLVAARGLFMIGQVPDDGIVRRIMTTSANPQVQVYAAGALVRSGVEGPGNVIRAHLSGGEPAARRAAADVLTSIGTRADLPALQTNAQIGPAEVDRAYALAALAAIGDEAARGRLPDLLGHADPAVRARAAYGAGMAWMTEEAPTLLRLLEDPDSGVRVEAARALLTVSDPQSPARYRRAGRPEWLQLN